MKKLLLLGAILLAACDDNSSSQSSNTNQPNTNVKPSVLNSVTQKDAEYYKNNPTERQAVLKECLEQLAQNKINEFEDFPGCKQAYQAKVDLEITAELKGDISADAFRRNSAQKISTALKAADDCRANNPSLPLDHPICKAITEYARQLKAECNQNNKASCADSNELFRRLRINE